MSVRNIRNHHTRGLLPAPTVRKRIGYYGPGHVARLELIRDLQADGFNLAAIQRLLEASSGSFGRLFGLRDAMLAASDSEVPDVITAAELAERIQGLAPEMVEVLRNLNLLVPLGEDRFQRLSPALGRAFDEAISLGMAPDAVAELAEQLNRDCDAIARRFVNLYVDQLWKPFADSGQPEELWQETIDAMRVLRTLASEALLAMFKLRMADRMAAAADTLLKDQVKRAQVMGVPTAR